MVNHKLVKKNIANFKYRGIFMKDRGIFMKDKEIYYTKFFFHDFLENFTQSWKNLTTIGKKPMILLKFFCKYLFFNNVGNL